MIRRYLYASALLLIAVGALAFRLPKLGERPFHSDEAVHAAKFDILWTTGKYNYDPNEFHGPTIYYAALPVMAMEGRHTFPQTQESDYRLVTVIFGAAMVLLLALFVRGFGWPAVLCAAVLTAISPAFVFYSRYYIQEVLFAFFGLGMLGCMWRYSKQRTLGWAVATGLFAGLMLASKETAPASYVSAAAGLYLSGLWARKVERRLRIAEAPATFGPMGAHLAAGLLTGVVVAVAFLTGFFTNWHAAIDIFRSYTPWLGRAGGTQLHDHPFFYYLRILTYWHVSKGTEYKEAVTWSEWPIVLFAAVGLALGFVLRRKRDVSDDLSTAHFAGVDLDLVRFLGFYTVILTLIYSVIRYKTPWCVLSMLDGMILLAGAGVVLLIRLIPDRSIKPVAALAAVLCAAVLGHTAYQSAYVAFVDERNPYVYAQPTPDVVKMSKEISDICALMPEKNNTPIRVVWDDVYLWPIPWYVRQCTNVQYINGSVPKGIDAPIVIGAKAYQEPLEAQLTNHVGRWYSLRKNVLMEELVEFNAWSRYVQAHPEINNDDNADDAKYQ